jgi:hypothetical protein
MVEICQASIGICIFPREDLQSTCGFFEELTNINVVTMGRPISKLDTTSLTKALRVAKAFLTQVDLAQSTNVPVVFGRGSIYKYEVNPVNNMKVCPPAFDYEGTPTNANTQNTRRNSF